MKAIAETPEYVAGDIDAEAQYYRAHYAHAASIRPARKKS
jgi:hypothetical protein